MASAATAAVGAVLVFAGGEDLAEENINDVIADHPDVVGLPSGTTPADIKALSGPIWDELVSDRAGTLTARAGFALFTAVCLLVLGLVARRGAATWSRVLLTVAGVVALFPHILILGDYEPDSVTMLSLAALLTAVVAVVLCWLPPVNRYAKQRKSGV
ncbi:hypothetical protein CP970_34905 [Streptomyces kanamyceticus]|uniref:Uncharacterized protein n=1 Tax=Streptomyces kanamyceticus TaxID=1967 RepID=A0A5J6GP63_STRKN|nr:hypothetical protein CP970_34905 [Streptomyces kanamyceticus]